MSNRTSRPRPGLRTSLLCSMLLAPLPGLAQMPVSSHRPSLTLITAPPCQDGMTLYGKVARRRDAGKPIDQSITTIVIRNPSADRVRKAEVANGIVREIYARPDWTPNEVESRYLGRCNALRESQLTGPDDAPEVTTLLPEVGGHP